METNEITGQICPKQNILSYPCRHSPHLFRRPSHYSWSQVTRYLKTTIPSVGRVNIYIRTLCETEISTALFFCLARHERIVLYRSGFRKFKRPRRFPDFGYAAASARRYSDTSLPLFEELLHRAGDPTGRTIVR